MDIEIEEEAIIGRKESNANGMKPGAQQVPPAMMIASRQRSL